MALQEDQSLKGFGVEDILRRILYATGLRTQSQLAEKLGVRRAAITDAKRRKSIPAEWFLKLARLYQLNPVWLESGLGAMHLGGDDTGPEALPGVSSAAGEAAAATYGRQSAPTMPAPDADLACHPDEFAFIPKVKAVPRMGPEGLETDGAVEGYYAFRQEWLRRKGQISQMRLLRVAGDSMEPTLRDGDAVLIDQSQKDIIYGKIYVLGIDDGILVKRLDKRPGKLVLISDNRQDYPPVEVELDESANVRIVGRVIWMARELM
jgi:hypothetical protein